MGAGHSTELWEIYSFQIFQTFCTGIVEIPQNYEVIQNTFSLNKNLKINFRVRIGKRLISKVHCFTTSLLCWPWGHTLLNLILHTFIQAAAQPIRVRLTKQGLASGFRLTSRGSYLRKRVLVAPRYNNFFVDLQNFTDPDWNEWASWGRGWTLH